MHAELYYTETIKLNMKDIVSVIELSFMVAIMLCPHKLVGKRLRNNLLWHFTYEERYYSRAQLVTYFVGCIGAEMLIKVSTNDCICPGNIVTYECTVFGGSGTSTVWKSNFFQCSSGKELVLVHRLLSEGEESHARICNDGDTVGRIVRIENNYFTSQLNVTLTAGIAGESIKCIGDNGTNTHRIGLLNLTTATAAG